MASTTSRGNAGDLAVAKVLRRFGYMTASRRHEGGPGDLLAWCPPGRNNLVVIPVLVEVKKTTDLPWRSDWGPEERQAMLQAAIQYVVEPLLAWWPPGLRGGPIWLPMEDWPR